MSAAEFCMWRNTFHTRRDGLQPSYLDELEALIEASGGRTLGLFSSMRAAKQATEELRNAYKSRSCARATIPPHSWSPGSPPTRPPAVRHPVPLARRRRPGSSLQLVVVDRIPFPRPDDPLASARQRAVEARGGKRFPHRRRHPCGPAPGQERPAAALDGRRGVIAILDPRLATARYAVSCAPPSELWTTHDPTVVRGALQRLNGRGYCPAVHLSSGLGYLVHCR